MKILVISSCYPRPSNLSNGIFVHQQVKALQELGAECHVIQPVNWFPPLGLHRFHPYWKLGRQQIEDTFYEYEGITIHHPNVLLKMPSRIFSEHPWDAEAKCVARYILKTKKIQDADIMYAQFLIHEGYVGVVIKEHIRIPLVSIALGDDVHAWPEQSPQVIPYLRKAMYGSDLILANSQRMAQDTEAWAEDERPVNVKTVYQGIDLERFRPINQFESKLHFRKKFRLDPACNYLLCVATPVKLKGWLNLLDSIQLLGVSFNGWRLLMVAPTRNDADMLDLNKEARRRSIADFVELIEKIDHDHMADLMRSVDAFVLPSYNEGLSNAVLEAMATGLPVIATHVGGHSEVIENQKNGLLIAPNNTEELTSAIQRVILSSSFREDIGSRARIGVQRIGTYKKNASLLLNYMKSISSI